MLSVGTNPPPTLLKESGVKQETGRRIRIGMVLDQAFPPDARVEREATALVEHGYEVHLLCITQSGDRRPLEEAYRGIYIHRVDPDIVEWRMPVTGWKTRLPYQGAVRNAFRHFWNIDTTWHTLISNFARDYGLDILHVHDLRLVPTALNITENIGIPLVADLHEHYPALMQMMKGRHNPQRGQDQRERWEVLESDAVRRSQQVFVVTEEARDRLLRKGLPGYKIAVIENTVDLEKFQNAPVDAEITRKYRPDFVLCYVGHINDTHRGIHTVIEAMALLKEEILELKFIAAGAYRPTYKAMLDDLIEQHGLEERVHFTDRLDETGFVTYIESSDLCLCPHLTNDHTNATFPNKVYLYHLFKKPILVSDAVPLQRYVEETGGGLTFEAGNAEMLADLIRTLYTQPERRRDMGRRGEHAVLTKYNWPQTAQNLLVTYDKLVTSIIEIPSA